MRIKWVVEFSVDEIWIADGFNLTADRAKTMLANDLICAFDSELGARIIKKPLDSKVAKLQGYKTVKAMKAS